MPKILATQIADGVAYVDELKVSPTVLAQSTTVAASRSAFVSQPFEISSSVTLTIGSGSRLVVI